MDGEAEGRGRREKRAALVVWDFILGGEMHICAALCWCRLDAAFVVSDAYSRSSWVYDFFFSQLVPVGHLSGTKGKAYSKCVFARRQSFLRTYKRMLRSAPPDCWR